MHLCHPLSKLTSTFSDFFLRSSPLHHQFGSSQIFRTFFRWWFCAPPGIPRASLGDASNVADSAQPKIKLSKSNGFMDADVLESIAITKEIRLDIELICLCLCIKYVYIYMIYILYIIYISYIYISYIYISYIYILYVYIYICDNIYIWYYIYMIICIYIYNMYILYIPSGKLLQFANWKVTIKLIGKLTTHGPFSIAMLNYQRVYIYIYDNMYICVHTCIWIICSAVSGRTVASC